jgi:hypothetical protein
MRGLLFGFSTLTATFTFVFAAPSPVGSNAGRAARFDPFDVEFPGEGDDGGISFSGRLCHVHRCNCSILLTLRTGDANGANGLPGIGGDAFGTPGGTSFGGDANGGTAFGGLDGGNAFGAPGGTSFGGEANGGAAFGGPGGVSIGNGDDHHGGSGSGASIPGLPGTGDGQTHGGAAHGGFAGITFP